MRDPDRGEDERRLVDVGRGRRPDRALVGQSVYGSTRTPRQNATWPVICRAASFGCG